jgi:hypothetical protein
MSDPLGFVPRDRCSWGHRFDDPEHRFRTVYVSLRPETCLREVLADLRPNLAAVARFVELHGPEAAEDIVDEPVTAAWRTRNVLASATIAARASFLDLTDAAVRNDVETEHVMLLASFDLPHLDMHEITTRRREVTQTIAGWAHDEGCAGVRFPSSRDNDAPCWALFEGRAHLERAGEAILLTDPAPEPLVNVAAGWRLRLEPAPVPVPGETK